MKRAEEVGEFLVVVVCCVVLMLIATGALQ